MTIHDSNNQKTPTNKKKRRTNGASGRKVRITLSLDEQILKALDNMIDGIFIRSRSQLVEQILHEKIFSAKKTVILAGGHPQELFIPSEKVYRPLAPIKGKPLIEHTLQLLKAEKHVDIIIVGHPDVLASIYRVVGTGAQYQLRIQYVEEKEPRGSAMTLARVKNHLTSDFLLIPCDIYFDFKLSEMYEFHRQMNSVATFAVYTRRDQERKYGNTIELDGFRIIKQVREPREFSSNLVNSMVGYVSPRIFDYYPMERKVMSLVDDVLPVLMEKQLLYGYPIAGEWRNVHTKIDLK